jgi:hypothetical protein
MKKILCFKKCLMIIFALCILVVSSACKTDTKKTGLETKNIIATDREKVIEAFKNTDDYMNIDKIFENMYFKHKDDEIISSIYNYVNAKFCYEAYINLESNTWLNKSIEYTSKISENYNNIKLNEILEFKKMLSSFKDSDQVMSDKKVLSRTEKRIVIDYINERYEFYDKKEGEYSAEKYTDKIWEETSFKFKISTTEINKIWSDISLLKD